MSDNITHLAAIKAHTGLVFRLTPHSRILQVKIEGTTLTVLVETHKVKDQKSSEVLTARAVQLWQWTPAEGWGSPVQVPDAAFAPTHLNKFGPGQKAGEWTDRVRWERMAHRVGSSRAPMDNYDRTHWDGDIDSTPQMRKHWKG